MNLRTFGWLILAIVVMAFLRASTADDRAPAKTTKSLPRGHAHNDYLHARPLLDALDHGFCSVEADIFLAPEGLLVAHEQKNVQPGRTLEKLYLDPLRERVNARGGRVYEGSPQFYLLIDVKTEAAATYTALDKVLARYADILSITRDGQFTPGAVTVILSGNRATDLVAKQAVRYVGIDGRPEDLKSNSTATLVPWISGNWSLLFTWKGTGEFPASEKQKLEEIVRQAHAQKRKIRFWATPENEDAWDVLLSAGVDFVNTDKLDEFQAAYDRWAKTPF
jgi:hypothetical protein